MLESMIDGFRGLGVGYAAGLDDVGNCRRALLTFNRSDLVQVANYLLGAGEGFHKNVRKMTLVNIILDKMGLAEPHAAGVFHLGNASST